MRAISILALLITAAGAQPGVSEQVSGSSGGTLNAVVSNGIVLTVQGVDIPIDYRPDGTYAGYMDGTSFVGHWRVDGARMCTRSRLSPAETCTVYPPGKKPGDVFEVVSPALGAVSVRINRQPRAPG